MQRQASPSEQWVKNALLYQIFLRNFSTEGDFRAAAARLDDLAKLGVNVLWLMPLHPIGRKMRKGALGCPYAVQHYEEICPSLGSPDDFRAFVRAAHDRGMKVIVDWVANHTSWDSHLIQTQPRFFKRGKKSKQQLPGQGGEEKEVTIDDVRQKIKREMMDDEEGQAVVQQKVGDDEEEEEEEEVILPPMEAWWDVAALDYGQPDSDDEARGFHIPHPLPLSTEITTVPEGGVRRKKKEKTKKTEAQRALGDYMAGVMKDWVRSFDIDGFRCDVSEMVPAFFWRRAVREIKAEVKPSIMMLSEGALPEHHVGGAFDLTYAWNVYDALTAVIRRAQPATHLHRVLKAEAKEYPEGALRLRFVSNHDKNVQDGSPLEHFAGVPATLAASAFVFTMGGYDSIRSVPMLYNGDEVGNSVRLSLFDKSVVPWNDLLAAPTGDLFRRHYARLIELRKRKPVLVHGSMHRVRTTHDHSVFAFVRRSTDHDQQQQEEEEEALVVISLSDLPCDDVEVTLPQLGNKERSGTRVEDWYGRQDDDDYVVLEVERTSPGKAVLRCSLPPFGFRILGLHR